MKRFEPSELIINDDGSVFHLHLRPQQLADNVLLVGDPGRVIMFKDFLENVEFVSQNREFYATTGTFRGRRVTLLSTGIGSDNIDIVINELDVLANVDFTTRDLLSNHRTLKIMRLGTCGAVQRDVEIGSMIYSDYSIGLDGLLNWYSGRDRVCDLDMEAAFMEHMKWNPQLANPYFVRNSELFSAGFPEALHGMTLTAPGFYGPQGRALRIALADPDYLKKLESFSFNGNRIMNFEMEGSAIAGLCRLMGHHGGTICLVIAQRSKKNMEVNYKKVMLSQAEKVLDVITQE